jgi:hypothetical protein
MGQDLNPGPPKYEALLFTTHHDIRTLPVILQVTARQYGHETCSLAFRQEHRLRARFHVLTAVSISITAF